MKTLGLINYAFCLSLRALSTAGHSSTLAFFSSFPSVLTKTTLLFQEGPVLCSLPDDVSHRAKGKWTMIAHLYVCSERTHTQISTGTHKSLQNTHMQTKIGSHKNLFVTIIKVIKLIKVSI